MNYRLPSQYRLYPDSTLIKITQELIGVTTLTTYNRIWKHRGTLVLDTDDLLQWIEKDGQNYEKGYYDCVCDDNHISIIDGGDYLHVTVAWLDRDIIDGLRGCRQDFRLLKSDILPLLVNYDEMTENTTFKTLYIPRRYSTTKIDVSHALPTLRRVLAVPRFRRAFSKAMRDCFQWPGDIITLYSDGRVDFGFSTASGIPEAGGLILRTSTIHQPSGDYQCNRYSVHT